MAVEIKVGPPQLAVHQGFTILITEPDGAITWPSDKGLYSNDTRLISAYAIYANGEPWSLLNSGAPAYYGCRIFLTNTALTTETGAVAPRSLSLVLSRVIDGGMHETHEITNHTPAEVTFNHEVVVRSDFADIFEVKSGKVVRRGRITSTWSDETDTLNTCYRDGAFMRGLRICCSGDDSVAWVNGRLSFTVKLAPGATWRGALLFDLLDCDQVLAAPRQCVLDGSSDQGIDLAHWRTGVTKLSSSVDGFERTFNQAVEDMAALRLPIEVPGDKDGRIVFVPAAGLPWFVALFGRDTLITSLQTMTLNPEFARGTLEVLGAWQAHERDDFRDAEPGKILHELRRGELAVLKLIPHTPYYGTADATPLYLMLLHATWKATGDLDLVRQHLAVAEGCLSWIDEYGDRDGDGFQEYGTRSGQGYENVGWKDSGNAVLDERGQMVKGPKALCELQGYVYAGWTGMAEIYTALGQAERASALEAKAKALYERFNEVFWSETEGFYAYCLDGDKTPIFSVASNPGHLLWCGLVPPDRAARVAARLMAPDMWSGWGIRTFSADNPAYNPYDYQVGAVWPHDNSLIALGCARYGLHEAASAIARDVHDAAGFFMQRQLPELYSGVQRDDTNFPVQYLGANVPQAWAAGSIFAFVQAMLGLAPDAPNDRLVIRPNLPEWLPDITLRDLRVGRHLFDIAFRRVDGVTQYEVLRGEAGAVVLEQARPGTARSGDPVLADAAV